MLVIDQYEQTKVIIDAVILDYNQTTIFGIQPSGKKTWLGKYDNARHAQVICRDIKRTIKSGEEKYTMP